MRKIAMVVLAVGFGLWVSSASANTTFTVSEGTVGQQALPFPVTEGALFLCEEGTVAPCATFPDVSDVVVFRNIFILPTPAFPNGLTTGSFQMCSNPDADASPADSAGCPTLLAGLPIVYVVEPAGGGDITYTPTAGQPGFAPDPTYLIKGDGPGNVVPEPASLLLIGSGLCTLATRLRRRNSLS